MNGCEDDPLSVSPEIL